MNRNITVQLDESVHKDSKINVIVSLIEPKNILLVRLAQKLRRLPFEVYVDNWVDQIVNNNTLKVTLIDDFFKKINNSNVDELTKTYLQYFSIDDIIFILYAKYNYLSSSVGKIIDNELQKYKNADTKSYTNKYNDQLGHQQTLVLAELTASNGKNPSLIKKSKNKKYTFTHKNADTLAGLFYHIHASDTFPCIIYDKFYRVHNSYTPTVNWYGNSQSIICKYISKNKIANAIITVDNAVFTIEPETGVEEEFITSLLPESKLEKVYNLVGNVYTFDISEKVTNQVLAEIIMNKDPFMKCVSVNDTVRPPRDKGSRLIYFTLASAYAVASITYTPSPEDKLNFKIVKASNNNVVKIFVDVFSEIISNAEKSLLTLFAKINGAVKNFQKFVSDKVNIASDEKKEPDEKPWLKDIEPEVFTEGYPRVCQGIRQPINIPQTDYSSDNERTLQFPKENTNNILINYYKCPDNTFKFAGLVRHTNSLGYAPCCFKEKQKEKKTYNEYYAGITLEEPNISYYIPTSDKFIVSGIGQFSPQNQLSVLFSKVYPNYKTDNNIRVGVERHPQSVLQCIKKSLNKDISATFNTTLEKNLNLIRQECYDMTKDQIQSQFNSDSYLDPTLCIRLLEKMYNINILLFTKSEQHPRGEMILPRHINGYCKLTRPKDRPTVMIYINHGAEQKDIKYPQCELIRLNDEEGKKIAEEKLWKVYDELSSFYYKGVRVEPFDKKEFQEKLEVTITEQFIDSYGKVRRLNLLGNNKKVLVVETSPIAPLDDVAVVDNLLPTPIKEDNNAAQTIFRNLQRRSTSSYKHSVSALTIYKEGWFNNMCIIRIYYINLHESLYKQYINNLRTATYLQEYSIYKLSQKISENPSNLIEKNDIQNILNVNPKPVFITEAGGTKLDSGLDDILVKQTLRTYHNDPETVKKYKSRKTIDAMVKYWYDFEATKSENVISCNSLVYAFQTDPVYPLIDTFIHAVPDGIFFFKHPKITSNKVFLTETTYSVDLALGKIDHWEMYDFNSTAPIRSTSTDPFLLHVVQPNGLFKTYKCARDISIFNNDPDKEYIDHMNKNPKHIIVTLDRKFLPLLDLSSKSSKITI